MVSRWHNTQDGVTDEKAPSAISYGFMALRVSCGQESNSCRGGPAGQTRGRAVAH